MLGNGGWQNKNETLHKPRDLKLPAHLYSKSQQCVRKTVSQPAENHTSHTPLGAMPSRTTHMYSTKSTEYGENQLIRYFLHAQKTILMAKVDM